MTSSNKIPVTLIPGDGIGPEVTDSAKRIVDHVTDRISWEVHAAGASVFKQGLQSGVPPETIESLKRTRVALKGPLETPVGYGEKSANVTLRKLFETYANLRPVRELPGVPTPYSGRGIDLVVVRENVEDLYAGIEHMQSAGVAQCLKVISKKGCEKIVRVAFELARAEGRKRVHCATKANIMKFTEGMLKRTFEEIAKEYPDIAAEHIIVDNCAHQLVKKPEQFEVIVTTNMNGDILSDLTSALVGGLGFAGSANIGTDIAIFEAVHGSAPKYAGKNNINPTAVIMSSIMMLRYLKLFDEASKVEHALLVTLEEGKTRTRDVVGDNGACTTTAYTDEIIKNLGRRSEKWGSREYKAMNIHPATPGIDPGSVPSGQVVGADVFVQASQSAEEMGKAMEAIADGLAVGLKMVSNRGTQVYPNLGVTIDPVDIYRCRFVSRDAANEVDDATFTELLTRVSKQFRWVHVEKLLTLAGAQGYTKAQGES